MYKFFIYKVVGSVMNLINDKGGTYQYLADKTNCKLFATYIEKNIIFWHWNQTISRKISSLTEYDIIYNFAKMDGVDSVIPTAI